MTRLPTQKSRRIRHTAPPKSTVAGKSGPTVAGNAGAPTAGKSGPGSAAATVAPASPPGRPARPPLALYAHFPWCVKKCPYCDFNSHPLRDAIDQDAYIDALLRDLDGDIARYALNESGGRKRRLAAIFLGGGTPSLFSAAAIGRLLRGIGARLPLARGIEITLEANPGGVEHDDFAAYRAAGVNRLSLGAQSFEDAQLAKLGRIHRADDTRRAVAAARAAGFDNLNLDLMHGLPGQSAADAGRDLDAALALAPAHLSLYQLTIEPHTAFHRRPPRLPNADRILDMQRALTARAARAGYRRYEVSSYARPGMRCRHNLNYWRFGDYLGIGAGAHGKITVGAAAPPQFPPGPLPPTSGGRGKPDAGTATAAERGDGNFSAADHASNAQKNPGAVQRYWKIRHPGRYLATAGGPRALAGARPIADADLLFEFLMNALRLTDGFPLSLARARTRLPAAEITAALANPVNRRWLLLNHHRIKCSATGYRLLNEILQEILPE